MHLVTSSSADNTAGGAFYRHRNAQIYPQMYTYIGHFAMRVSFLFALCCTYWIANYRGSMFRIVPASACGCDFSIPVSNSVSRELFQQIIGIIVRESPTSVCSCLWCVCEVYLLLSLCFAYVDLAHCTSWMEWMRIFINVLMYALFKCLHTNAQYAMISIIRDALFRCREMCSKMRAMWSVHNFAKNKHATLYGIFQKTHPIA